MAAAHGVPSEPGRGTNAAGSTTRRLRVSCWLAREQLRTTNHQLRTKPNHFVCFVDAAVGRLRGCGRRPPSWLRASDDASERLQIDISAAHHASNLLAGHLR